MILVNLAAPTGNSYDLYDSKDFSFVKRFTFYSYEDVDVDSLGHYGKLNYIIEVKKMKFSRSFLSFL